MSTAAVAEVAPAARDAGTIFPADAAQAVGKVSVAVEDLGVDLCSTVSFRGVHGADLLAHAPGVAASTGSACHANDVAPSAPSATLFANGVASGVAPEIALSAVQLSLGRDTIGAAVAVAVDRLVVTHHQAREEHSVPETSKRE